MKLNNKRFLVTMNGGRTHRVTAANEKDASDLVIQHYKKLILADDKADKQGRLINVGVQYIELDCAYTMAVVK